VAHIVPSWVEDQTLKTHHHQPTRVPWKTRVFKRENSKPLNEVQKKGIHQPDFFEMELPSRELTYPTLGKGKSIKFIFKSTFGRGSGKNWNSSQEGIVCLELQDT